MIDFTSYYFTTLVPLIMNEYEKNQDPSVDLKDSNITFTVEKFLEQTKSFIILLDGQLTDNARQAVRETICHPKQCNYLFYFNL